jgi:hypothetical protein
MINFKRAEIHLQQSIIKHQNRLLRTTDIQASTQDFLYLKHDR